MKSNISGNDIDSQKYRESLDNEFTMQQTIILLSFAFLALLLNVALMAVILSDRNLRRKTMYYFVLSLVFSQVVMVCVVLPLCCFHRSSFVHNYITALTVMAYISNLCVVTKDRHVAMTEPLRYRAIMTKKRGIIYIISCWISAAVIQVLPIFYHSSNHQDIAHKVFLSMLVLIYMVIPLPYIAYMYTSITIQAWRMFRKGPGSKSLIVRKRRKYKNHSALEQLDQLLQYTFQFNTLLAYQKQNTTIVALFSRLPPVKFVQDKKAACKKPLKELQIALVFIMICLTYTVTWMPVMYMTVLQIIGKPELEPPSLSDNSIFLIAFNAIADPLLYGLGLKEVRRVILKKMGRRKRRARALTETTFM